MENEIFHILLADDDEGDRLLFTDAFSELKIITDVRSVNNGMQLLKLLNSEGVRLPHFLFLDLNMPGKNGLECLKEIRSNSKLKNMAIAIYSTSENETDIEESFLNGANIYITKPANYNLLKQVLERAVMTTFQYRDKSMNRENFMLKI